MLSGRLSGAASRKLMMAVSIALIGSVAFAVIIFLVYLNQSSELAEKSEVILLQGEEILASRGAVEDRQAEIGAKTAELARVQLQMDMLSQQLVGVEQSLQQESKNAAALQTEIDALNEQATLLHTEISALQSKIHSDEQRIAELARLNEASDRITVSHFGLGVNESGQGMVFPVSVEIIESGAGILSVDINNVQYEPGFQTAVRSAATAAAQYSGESISDKDIIVRFAPGGSLSGDELVKVDGSSAGAVIAAMIAAGLSDKEINASILVTGSISEDGTVGRIGSLQEKLDAAHSFGAEAMLVPESQEFESNTIQVIGVSDMDELMMHLTVP